MMSSAASPRSSARAPAPARAPRPSLTDGVAGRGRGAAVTLRFFGAWSDSCAAAEAADRETADGARGTIHGAWPGARPAARRSLGTRDGLAPHGCLLGDDPCPPPRISSL